METRRDFDRRAELLRAFFFAEIITFLKMTMMRDKKETCFIQIE